jgi:hypothetical protein
VMQNTVKIICIKGIILTTAFSTGHEALLKICLK